MAHRNPFLLEAYKVAEIIEAAKYMPQGFKYVVGVGCRGIMLCVCLLASIVICKRAAKLRTLNTHLLVSSSNLFMEYFFTNFTELLTIYRASAFGANSSNF